MTTADRWGRIETLYHRALEHAPGDRAAFLADACGGDETLRREVESLLDQPVSGGALVPDLPGDALWRPALAALQADTAAEDRSDIVGMTLGPFQVRALLGVGGMGEVYRARDTRLDRDVAIKMLPRQFAAVPDRLARFEREARLLAALNHPNIAAIHGIEDVDGVRVIVMELVDGDTLAQRAAGRALPVADAIAIARQIADALDAAHERGIMHRDLKPANIKVTADDTVKLLDFGLAKAFDAAGAPDSTVRAGTPGHTTAGLVIGTPAYMSPEQARGLPVDKRTDIWAFGCVLYEMLTGEAAFAAATVSDTIAAVLGRDPDWRALPAGVAPPVRRLLERCLERDPKRRQRDIADARHDLDAASVAVDAAAATTRRRWVAAGAIAAAALAAGGAIGWRIGTRNATQPAASRTGAALTRLTWDAGLATDPALAPDGSLVAYASDAAGQGDLDLWLQRVGGGTPLQLTSDRFDDREPAFSPDGASIAFRSERGGGGVYVMPSLGGDPRLVAPHGRRPQFSPDGKAIAYWTGPWLGGTRVAGSAVFLVPANGGTQTRLAPGFVSARSPVWSPDGRSLLFFGRKNGDAEAATTLTADAAGDDAVDWWWVPAAGGEPTPTGIYPTLTRSGVVFSAPWWLESLPDAWTADGVYFSATVAQATNLWRARISPATGRLEGAPVQLTNGSGADRLPSVDRAGRVVFQASQSTEGVFELALDANRGTSLKTIDRLVADWGYAAHRGSLSRNGRVLVYPKHRPDSTELWVKDVVSGAERHVVTTRRYELNPTISPDGSQVAYTSSENGRSTGKVIAAAGGVANTVCDDCSLHAWLADGIRLFVVYTRRHPRVAVLDTATLTAADVFDTDALVQRVFATDDDRSVAIGARDGAWIAPLTPGHVATAATSTVVSFGKSDVTPGRVCGWSPDGRLLYSLLGLDGFRCLYAQRFDPDRRTVGETFAVHHFHDPRRLWGSSPMSNAIVEHGFVFDQMETAGSIWILDATRSR